MRPDSKIRSQAGFLIRYGVAGVASAVSHMGGSLLLIELFSVDPRWATNFGFALSILVSYTLQRSWVFRSTVRHARAVPRFLLVVAIGGFINWSIVALGIAAGIDYVYVQAVALVVIPISNLILNSLFTFREHSAPVEPKHL